jgi:hypothetical protein
MLLRPKPGCFAGVSFATEFASFLSPLGSYLATLNYIGPKRLPGAVTALGSVAKSLKRKGLAHLIAH